MFEHKPVLMDEAIDGLAIKASGTYIDCTVGGGGHSEQIVKRLDKNGLLIAIDQDKQALKAAKERLANYKNNVIFIHSNFRNISQAIRDRNIENIDGVLFDLGVSSPQLDQGDRGFSYQHDAILDMRMNQAQTLTAKDIVNDWPYKRLVSIFFKYGEEKFSKQIARKIESKREIKPIETTHELVEVIKEAIPAPARRKGGHPAKRTFQALRIAVNDELSAFNEALHQVAKLTNKKGRIAVITFHSLEDRLCKQVFKKWSSAKQLPRNLPVTPDQYEPPFKLITRKAISPSTEELTDNRRARSAKLRIVEKVSDWEDEYIFEEGWKYE